MSLATNRPQGPNTHKAKGKSKKVVLKRTDGVVQAYWKKNAADLKKTETWYKGLGITKDKMSGYNYPMKRGWLIPYLLMIDEVTTKRWNWWSMALMTEKLPPTGTKHPIPQVRFDDGHSEAKRMLKKCVDSARGFGISRPVENLMDWILWGLHAGIQKKPADIPEKLNKIWYTTFDLGIMMKHPADYWAWLLAEQGNKVGPGWFATPMNVVNMMTSITDQNSAPWESFNDPTAGTGVFPLSASNKTVNMYVQDISFTAVKALTINGYLYIPWLIRPPSKKMLENIKKQYPKKKESKNPSNKIIPTKPKVNKSITLP